MTRIDGVELPMKSGINGIISASGFMIEPELDSLPALYARLQQKFARYRHLSTEVDADVLRLRSALLAGELGNEARPIKKAIGFNRLHRTYFLDLFALNKGTASSLQTMAFKYFAIGNKYNPISFSDETLGNEIYRRAPDTIAEDGQSTIYATTLISASQANPTLNTTVTSSTATIITVASATGAIVTGRIQVITANNTYYATITNVSGNQLTVADLIDSGGTTYTQFPAADIPQSGDEVDGTHCEAAIVTRDDATGTANTGKILNRRIFDYAKRTGSVANSVLYDFIFTYVTVD
jgi:hypothetical protein